MNDPEHGELAVGWLLHTLEPEQERRFLAHVRECEECRRVVGETSSTIASVGCALPQYDPPPGLRDRILAAAAAEELPLDDDGGGSVVPLRRPGGAGRRRWVVRGLAVAAVAAVVALLAGLSTANRSLRDERDSALASADEAAQVVRMLDAASAPGVRHATLAAPSGALVGLVADDGRGPRVLATGLAGNRNDQTYVLWGLEGGRPVGLGAFDLPGSASTVRSVRSEQQAAPFTGYAVSLEPGRTVPAAPTMIVARGTVGT